MAEKEKRETSPSASIEKEKEREREKLTDAAKRQSAPRVGLIYAELILILINEQNSREKETRTFVELGGWQGRLMNFA